MRERTILIAGGAALLGACAGYWIGDGAPAAGAQPSAERPAYMVVMGTVHDREAFMAGYVAHLPALYERHGGQYLAVTGDVETLEGEIGFSSVVMSRWPSADAARAFWSDPDYRDLASARIDNEWGDFDVFLVEGLPRAGE